LNTTAATVVLPCPPDQFRDFIAGLLGRAQTIETLIPGPFEVTKDNVENLYHLLEQRISSQNEATLIQFTARVVYDDNSSVLLNSLEQFMAYNEVKPLVSTGLHLSWTYLIKFQSKPFPEKQSVQVSFETSGRTSSFSGIGAVQVLWPESKPIIVRIEHTDRTWGADIEALLIGNLELLKIQVGIARKLVNAFSGWIGAFCGFLAMALTLTATYKISDEFASVQIEKVAALKKAVASGSGDLISSQLDFVTNLVASGIWTRFSLFSAVLLIILLIGSVALAIIIGEMAHVVVPSFLLLTNRSAAYKVKELSKLQNSWYKLVGSFLAAMFLGVASNGLFYIALKYLGLPS
jgi:hypothetical protein